MSSHNNRPNQKKRLSKSPPSELTNELTNPTVNTSSVRSDVSEPGDVDSVYARSSPRSSREQSSSARTTPIQIETPRRKVEVECQTEVSNTGRPLRFTTMLKPFACSSSATTNTVPSTTRNERPHSGFSRSVTNAFPSTLNGYPVPRHYGFPDWSQPPGFIDTANRPNSHNWGAIVTDKHVMQESAVHELSQSKNIVYQRKRKCVRLTIDDRHIEMLMDDDSILTMEEHNVVQRLGRVTAAPYLIVASGDRLPSKYIFTPNVWGPFFNGVTKLEVSGIFLRRTIMRLVRWLNINVAVDLILMDLQWFRYGRLRDIKAEVMQIRNLSYNSVGSDTPNFYDVYHSIQGIREVMPDRFECVTIIVANLPPNDGPIEQSLEHFKNHVHLFVSTRMTVFVTQPFDTVIRITMSALHLTDGGVQYRMPVRVRVPFRVFHAIVNNVLIEFLCPDYEDSTSSGNRARLGC